MMPKVSVIIPTFNRNEILRKTLASLRIQTFRNFEVLICDDGGTEKADKIVNEFNSYFSAKYYWQKDKGGWCPAVARNMGWKKSKGDYLLFLDCDIILPPKSIEIMYNWLSQTNNKKEFFHVTPKGRIHVRDNLPEKLILKDFDRVKEYSVKGKDANIPKGNVSISTTGMFYKKIVDKMGGFDEILFTGLMYEDIELGARLYGFLNNRRKLLPFFVYHIDHYNKFTKRDMEPRKKIPISKALIKEKFEKLGFKYRIKYRPEKKHSDQYYKQFLTNKQKMLEISKNLRQKYKKLIEDNA